MTRTNNKNNLSKENNRIDSVMYLVILFLVAFIPFEDFILKFLPGPDRVYFYSRFLSELLIYASFVTVIGRKLIQEIPLVKTPIDVPMAIFWEIVIISTIVNQASIVESFINIRPFLRYVIFFYLIVNVSITLVQANKILLYTIYAGIVQLAIGIAQFLSRGALDKFLQPRASDVEVGGASKNFVLLSGREIGSIYSAAGDTILFASFMIIFLILIISKLYMINTKDYDYQGKKYSLAKISRKQENIILITLIPCTLAAIGLTYARAFLLAAIVIMLAYLLLKFGSKRRMGIFLTIISGLILILSIQFVFLGDSIRINYSGNPQQKQQSIVDNMTTVFTPEYIKVARQQRLGIVIDVPLTVIYNKPFLGYGPDMLKTIDDLNSSPTKFIAVELRKETFEDVYWAALLAYYGVSGLLILIWMFYRIYKWAKIIYHRTQEYLIKELSLSLITLTLLTIYLLFFNQTLEFRIYGQYFWLLPGLIFNLYHQEKLGYL